MPQTAKRLGIRMRYLFVSDLENDSLNLFQPTAEAISQYMPIIFVANFGRNTTDAEFFESQDFQALLSQYQAPVIRLGLFDLEMKKQIDGRNSKKKLLTWGRRETIPISGFWDSKKFKPI